MSGKKTLMPDSILISRDLLASRLWKDRPFAKGQAYLDLCLQAASKKETHVVNDTDYTVVYGELVTTVSNLVDAWQWTPQRVGLFLKALQKQEFIIASPVPPILKRGKINQAIRIATVIWHA